MADLLTEGPFSKLPSHLACQMAPLGQAAPSPTTLTLVQLPASSLSCPRKGQLYPKTHRHHLPGHRIPVQNKKLAESRIQEALGLPSTPNLDKANVRQELHFGQLPKTFEVTCPPGAAEGGCSRSEHARHPWEVIPGPFLLSAF